MVIIFLVLLILPFCVFTSYSSNRIQNIMQEQTLISARKTFDEACLSLETWLDNMNTVSSALAYDSLVSYMFSTDPDGYPVSTQYRDYRTLTASFSYLRQLSGIDHIRLYLGDDYIYSNNKVNFFSFDGAKDAQWFQRLVQFPSAHWFSPLDFADQPLQEQGYFSFMRLFYSPNDLSVPAAVLRIDVAQSTFEQSITGTTVTENGIMFLLEEEHAVISFSDNENLSVPDGISTSLDSISEKQWETITIQGDMYYVFYTNLDTTEWKLVTLIPYSDIHSVSRDLTVEMLLVMLILVVIVCILAFFLTDSTLHRIGQLAESMKRVEYGNTNVRFSNSGRDEIGQLITHFNHMMNRLNQLMEEKVQYGQDIKNLELKALQAQINPHFLYNTLDTINCLAIQRDVPEISDVVSSLAAFYKISLSKGKEMIRIKDEITHAKMYLNIQNTRFCDQIEAQWDISPEIEELYMIKIVLQPIIENAVIHGIYEREDGTGKILITGWLEKEDVYITIKDNGVGMSAQVLERNFPVLDKTSSTHAISDVPGGYGIRNIQDRLCIAYGTDYGLSCQSTPGEGTMVTIHIPACR